MFLTLRVAWRTTGNRGFPTSLFGISMLERGREAQENLGAADFVPRYRTKSSHDPCEKLCPPSRVEHPTRLCNLGLFACSSPGAARKCWGIPGQKMERGTSSDRCAGSVGGGWSGFRLDEDMEPLSGRKAFPFPMAEVACDGSIGHRMFFSRKHLIHTACLRDPEQMRYRSGFRRQGFDARVNFLSTLFPARKSGSTRFFSERRNALAHKQLLYLLRNCRALHERPFLEGGMQ